MQQVLPNWAIGAMGGFSALHRPSVCFLLVVSAVSVTGCQRNHSSQPFPSAGPSVPDANTPYSTSFSASGWTYHLRCLHPDPKADTAKAKAVWRDLFPEMAKDPTTRALLKRLHAGLPVEFVVLDARQAKDKAALTAPPPEGTAVVMRVADISFKEEKSKLGTIPVRVVSYGRAIRMSDAAAPGSLAALAQDMKEEPLPGGSLVLAMEDYVLRHAPGCVVIGGPVRAGEKLPPSVDKQRRDLDKRIQKYEGHAKAYFDARRKR